MNIEVNGIPLILIISFTIVSGCLSSKTTDNNDNIENFNSESESFSGIFDFPETQSDEDIVASIRIITSYSNITTISIALNFEDNDPNTNEDFISLIEISDLNEDGSNNAYYSIDVNGPMPYQGVIEINELDENGTQSNLYTDTWMIFVHTTLKPSDDQWPGPLIWRGATDSGFRYDIDVTYEYRLPEGDMNEG